MEVSGKKNNKTKYEASMILSGVGDALGFKNGQWEMCRDGQHILQELEAMGGLQNLQIKPPQWLISDDTLLHIATCKALLAQGPNPVLGKLLRQMAIEYKTTMSDMLDTPDRIPGKTCKVSCESLDPWSKKPVLFNPNGGGSGAAMRAMCIGLRFPKPEQLEDLLTISIESGRLTHHHPTGYLGSLASALFTSYAIQAKPLRDWGAGLLNVLPRAKEYVKASNQYTQENMQAWVYFESRWKEYLGARGILDNKNEPNFPENYDVNKRDSFYAYLSYDGVGGSSGHDAPMIAYDALLGCSGKWAELCYRAMLHGGDSDTTGAIAGALFGALYGFSGVPENHYSGLEQKDELFELANQLYTLSDRDSS
ncbi:ADP-ribosylhydrolase ARH1-like [Dreissena polymorpha]|uniref:ADP-ribosylhydrolase ARH1 n=1 Tax=Dreissena polymorpha TaxID=45954 RepID=A0A9D4RCS2_DREPO|nr:ADP-ribosylhydrolase ARH1-like [Dreissena polymorpha]KAH3863489.1 hypothetical protein DPMN_026478 [Dreissena polymorpha]